MVPALARRRRHAVVSGPARRGPVPALRRIRPHVHKRVPFQEHRICRSVSGTYLHPRGTIGAHGRQLDDWPHVSRFACRADAVLGRQHGKRHPVEFLARLEIPCPARLCGLQAAAPVAGSAEIRCEDDARSGAAYDQGEDGGPADARKEAAACSSIIICIYVEIPMFCSSMYHTTPQFSAGFTCGHLLYYLSTRHNIHHTASTVVCKDH